ncbi:MAG: Rpn family recombination-promoting nuclease/putative transposase, partial [Clostridium sp.]|nr:Rpn family recombination-promoting nuclease/putative transposase [Clostridium sp.]
MSQRDSVTNNYIRQNRIFADAFNFFIYGGRQIIDPNSLIEMDTQEIIIPHNHQTVKKQSIKRTRDLVKLVRVMTNENAAYMILAVENQSHIHYAMPVRVIMYDSMQYAKQVQEIVAKRKLLGNQQGLSADEYLSRFQKSDTIYPVVTLVIYFEDKEWDGPLSLHEMFQTKDEDLLALVPDYKLNLLAPASIKDVDFNRFQSSLGEVMS